MKLYNVIKRAKDWKLILDSGFWFVDIQRTGSTSLKTILGTMYGELYGKTNDPEINIKVKGHIKDHTPALKVRRVIGRDRFAK